MKTVFRLSLCLAALLCSCTTTRQNSKPGIASRETATASLTERVELYWAAKTAEDWDKVFDYQYPPGLRAQLVRDEFKTWSSENEPLKVHSYSKGRIDTDGDMGWAEVYYKTSVRRYPTIPPRDARVWQKWHKTNGDWYPVPQQFLEAYPESPAVRDAAEEAKLRARFEATFDARKTRDWARLYEYTDPRDRADVTLDMYSEAENQFQYLGAQVHWVEVIGDHGKVYVTYHHKLTDTSMEKLTARDAVITEKWTRTGNEWYRDLKR